MVSKSKREVVLTTSLFLIKSIDFQNQVCYNTNFYTPLTIEKNMV